MSDPVLNLEGVSKTYQKYASVWHRLARWCGLKVASAQSSKVLSGITFTLAQGEVVAIIGQNGAGKSTLLKLVTGVSQPSEGGVHYRGRVAAILELGLGFNPEFTGRQNVYVSGAVMGFTHLEISEMMDSIQDFAEIGEYFDRSVKTYSSGMMARLAFAVATAKRPDLLIVDEILSVGDSYFQHKSFDRIRKFKDEGSAILFVSHSMGDVKALCDRVVLLDKGAILKIGLPDEVVDYYNALIAEKENSKLSIEQRREKNGWLYSKSGTGEVTATELVLRDANSREEVRCACVGQELELCLSAKVHSHVERLVLGFMIRDKLGHVVWGTNTWHTGQILENLDAGSDALFVYRFDCNFGPGSYSVSPALVSSDTHLIDNYEWQDNALVFDVINAEFAVFVGTTYLAGRFAITVSG